MDINNEEMIKDNHSFENKIFAEQMEILHQNLLVSVPASFLCATIVLIALYRIPHSNQLLYWFLMIILLSAVRMVSTLFFHKHSYIKNHYYLFLIATAIAGALWGFAGYTLMPQRYVVEQMVTIIVIAGVTAGGIQSLQASFTASFIYVNLALLPLCIWIYSQNNTAYFILGSATTLYLLFTIVIAWRGYHFFKHTLTLKYQNLELSESLSFKNVQLNNINHTLIEKENNLRLIHDHAPIGMAILTLDGKWLNVNNKLCEIVGYDKQDIEHLTMQELTYQDDLAIGIDDQAKLMSGKLQSYQIEKRFVRKDGELIWLLINVSLVRDNDGKPFYFISQIQDINDRKQNEKIISGLSRMNEMLQLCHESAEAYPIICQTAHELFTGLNGGLYIHNKLTKKHEAVGYWGNDLILTQALMSNDCWALRAGNTYFVNDPKKETLCRHFTTAPINSYICIPLIVQSEIIGLLHFNTSSGLSITEHQLPIINNFSEILKLSLANISLNEALQEQVIHDPLTGIFNRRYLNQYLSQSLERVNNEKTILSVCMLDLDYFKRINDQYGHDAGDEVLKYFGTLLKNTFSDNDVPCRYGGEEFVVLMNTDIQHAALRMEMIREEIKKAKIYSKNVLLPQITISVGIAEAPQHGQTLNEILRAADSTLYNAKESGRDKITCAQSHLTINV